MRGPFPSPTGVENACPPTTLRRHICQVNTSTRQWDIVKRIRALRQDPPQCLYLYRLDTSAVVGILPA